MYHQVKDIVGAVIWKEEGVELESLRRDLVFIEEDYNLLKRK